MAAAHHRFADRGMRVVAGYLAAGADTLEERLDEARALATRGLPGGAHSALSQLGRRLDRHLRLHERVILPMLEAQGRSRRLAASCRREHERLRALVDEADASVGDKQAFLRATRLLGEELTRHQRREQRILDALEA